jgi:pseudouridine-5'-phosphate glycosidase
VLETHGVPIIGYGTDMLPAFFARSSGLPVDIRLDTPEAVAKVMQVHHKLGLQNGILVTVPVPEADACEPEMVETAISQATQEADEQGIHGPATTPWLLRRVVELTNGRSLQANVALLRNNGTVAATIACALTSS